MINPKLSRFAIIKNNSDVETSQIRSALCTLKVPRTKRYELAFLLAKGANTTMQCGVISTMQAVRGQLAPKLVYIGDQSSCEFFIGLAGEQLGKLNVTAAPEVYLSLSESEPFLLAL